MTRKDYRLIAATIAECNRIYHAPCPRDVAENLAYYLKKDSSSFDKERFIEACGFSQNRKSA